jgi:hypothetical protein
MKHYKYVLIYCNKYIHLELKSVVIKVVINKVIIKSL